MVEKEQLPSSSRELSSRGSVENLFMGGAGVSLGPMTLVLSFFVENDPEKNDCRSFSQLLDGTISEAPTTVPNIG
ncbi:UNVERIFIED_CONTAM: hypothetical protein Sradi_0834400 [Sesamum radiatum]|uniref:Uncharacterized protein n=1 Tax=Sesamum radiatum TaxID=300843 RepID=A0AAW2VQT0_SESRA